MKIVGCDLHTRYRQIALLDQESGELIERRLEHENGEARAFYAALWRSVRVGIEATGHTRWFERMLAELGHELWIGDAAQIRKSMVRKQKTDARDAAHLLDLLSVCVNYRPLPTCLDREPRRHRVFPGDLRKEVRVAGSPSAALECSVPIRPTFPFFNQEEICKLER